MNGPAFETPVLLTGIVVDINISSGDEAEEVTFEGEEADADVIRRDRGRTFPVLPVTADSVPVSHSKLNLRPTWSEYELDASRIPVKQIVDDFAENLTDAADCRIIPCSADYVYLLCSPSNSAVTTTSALSAAPKSSSLRQRRRHDYRRHLTNSNLTKLWSIWKTCSMYLCHSSLSFGKRDDALDAFGWP